MNTRFLALLLITVPLAAQVTYERLPEPEKEPQNWLTYFRELSEPTPQSARPDHHVQRG